VRPSWDEWALGIALAVSQRGDCTRRQVGAVILDANRRVVSVGYNGTRPGEVGCLDGGCPRGRSDVPPGSPYDDCISSHAEQNALMHGDSTKFPGGTIYVTTEPCAWCMKMLRCSGLFRAVWSTGASSDPQNRRQMMFDYG